MNTVKKTASVGGLGVEGSSKMEKGLMDTDNIVVIAGGGGIRGLNGNRKSTIKITNITMLEEAFEDSIPPLHHFGSYLKQTHPITILINSPSFHNCYAIKFFTISNTSTFSYNLCLFPHVFPLCAY